jgi:crotonobetainyl-CoA:carnitine CoA-transferase CaiB-like acyl-CoA transferase
MSEHALSGVRVMDLTRVLSGPMTTMILADLGADVIKIEDVRGGDDTRHWGPPFAGDAGDVATYYLSANRGKRSIGLDLKSEGGLEVALRLADQADVLVENFRPGTAARLGLGYEQLSARNPRLVYASISGFGQDGPDAALPGYDAIAQARSGMMSVTGEPDGEPMRPGVATADIGAGMWATIGVLAALRARDQTGRGQLVDVSLLDGQLAWLSYVASGYLATGREPARYGTAHPSIVPYQAFPASDGYIMIAVGNDKLWQLFTEAIGEPALAGQFPENKDRVSRRDELLPRIEAILRTRPRDEWLTVLTRAGIPCGPIATVPEAMADAQTRGMIAEFGDTRVAGSPLRLSGTPVSYRLPPPGLGEHTDEVLAELGYSGQQIADLRSGGSIR